MTTRPSENSPGSVERGDFTRLARAYVHRPGYSVPLLAKLAGPEADRTRLVVADVGAGTGKLTANLIELRLRGHAVEPNDAMRAEGVRLLGHGAGFRWLAGAAEATTLPDASVDWVLMGSAFHWADAPRALAEFHRILRDGGRFTALWNPRDIEASPLEQRAEAHVRRIVPELRRVSSGRARYTAGLENRLVATGHFADVTFDEAPHELRMTPERYLGAWRSVNDIQSQAGPARFDQIMRAIEAEIAGMAEVIVPYRTRAWTVGRK